MNLLWTLLPKGKQHLEVPVLSQYYYHIWAGPSLLAKLSESPNETLSTHFCTVYNRFKDPVKRSLNLNQVKKRWSLKSSTQVPSRQFSVFIINVFCEDHVPISPPKTPNFCLNVNFKNLVLLCH